jgi:hypothetical protein
MAKQIIFLSNVFMWTRSSSMYYFCFRKSVRLWRNPQWHGLWGLPLGVLGVHSSSCTLAIIVPSCCCWPWGSHSPTVTKNPSRGAEDSDWEDPCVCTHDLIIWISNSHYQTAIPKQSDQIHQTLFLFSLYQSPLMPKAGNKWCQMVTTLYLLSQRGTKTMYPE